MPRPDRDRPALLVATVLGVGYAPLVPGTFGSIPGVLLAWLLWWIGGPFTLAAGIVAVTLAGLWASERAAVVLARNDPRPVVVDEVAGQMMTLAFLTPTPLLLLTGFVVFRVLDVWKPFPARRLESLPGGSGIMADDLVAGIYGNVALNALLYFFPGIWGAT